MDIAKLIVFENEDLLVISKPQGIASAPGDSEDITTYVIGEFPDIKNTSGYRAGEGGLLNRLDNETGGLLMYAKSDDAFKYYSGLQENQQITKRYVALVDPEPASESGIITIPIAHHPTKKSRMVTLPYKGSKGRPQSAETSWKKGAFHSGYRLLDVTISKGVRHQIRVHLASIGSPIVGDKLYNKKKYPDFTYHQLFACGLEFVGRNGENVVIKTVFSDLA